MSIFREAGSLFSQQSESQPTSSALLLLLLLLPPSTVSMEVEMAVQTASFPSHAMAPLLIDLTFSILESWPQPQGGMEERLSAFSQNLHL